MKKNHTGKVCELGWVISFLQYATWLYNLYFVHQLFNSQNPGFRWVKFHDPTALIRAPGTNWNIRWVGWRSRSEVFNACGASNRDSSLFQPVVAGEPIPPPQKGSGWHRRDSNQTWNLLCTSPLRYQHTNPFSGEHETKETIRFVLSLPSLIVNINLQQDTDVRIMLPYISGCIQNKVWLFAFYFKGTDYTC
jgi:hypothetical protein